MATFRWTAVGAIALAVLAGCTAAREDVGGDESNVIEGTSNERFTGVWTNWWREEFDLEKGKAKGLLKILAIRQSLTANNLFDINDAKAAPVDCSAESIQTRRTIDGTCNDLARPRSGAAGTRFGRNIDPAKSPADDKTLLSPNPREISVKLLARDVDGKTPKVKEVDFLNLTAASWIQFQVHDWVNHPDQTTDVYEVRFQGESFFVPKGVREQAEIPGFPALRVHNNTNTHWWDGSQLYGSDDATARRLRSKDGVHFAKAEDLVPGGLLRLENDNLPVVDGKEDSGFTRNWWVGLSMLHTLFAREHNAIARTIKSAHPELSDDHVYDIARMTNAAVMAKIHTVEWTPAILDNPQLRAGMMLNWNGLSLPGVGTRPPILGHPADPALTKIPYALTEEFASVYRLHSLLPETMRLHHLGASDEAGEDKDIASSTHGRLDVSSYTMGELFDSFGHQHPGQLTLHNFPTFLRRLVVERPVAGKSVELAKIDMALTDVLRDRERGVPRYNAFRRGLGLLPILKLEDLFIVPEDGTPAGVSASGTLTSEQQRFVAELRSVYGKSDDGKALTEAETVERLDLLVGCLAESVRAPGFGFGETAFQVFILMASRRLQADRFYTTDYRPEVYTQEGIDWVKTASMKSVLLRHYPELTASLDGIDNAFSPWRPRH